MDDQKIEAIKYLTWAIQEVSCGNKGKARQSIRWASEAVDKMPVKRTNEH